MNDSEKVKKAKDLLERWSPTLDICLEEWGMMGAFEKKSYMLVTKTLLTALGKVLYTEDDHAGKDG